MPAKGELLAPATVHLSFDQPGVVGFRELPGRPINQGEGFIETNETLISPGTESHDLYHGKQYPKRTVGYAHAGTLTLVRSQSRNWQEGDRIATNYGHATGHVVDLSEKNRMIKLPEWVSDRQGAFLPQLLPIAIAGVIHLSDKLNRSRIVKDIAGSLKDKEIVINGGGPIGLLTGVVAKHAEASRVVLIDDVPDRLARAESLGIETVNYAEVENRDPVPRIREMLATEKILSGFNCGSGADGVINTANSGIAVNNGYRMLRDGGVNLDMAYHIGELRGVYKGDEFHVGGLIDQSGYVNKLPPHQRQKWSKGKMAAAGLDILSVMGEALEETLVTHEGEFAQAQTIYERIKDRESNRVITSLRPGDLTKISVKPWDAEIAVT